MGGAYWRNNIKGINNLDDIDPVEMMTHIRHNYLETAKDLCKDNSSKKDVEFGEACLMTACCIDAAIDAFKNGARRMY